MARPLIALLTDFGLRDHYAGTMKGVALGICPDATFVDISHDVPAHDILAGALELAESYRYFPAGTIFLVVVDPGVGSPQRPQRVDEGPHTGRRDRRVPRRGGRSARLVLRVGRAAAARSSPG